MHKLKFALMTIIYSFQREVQKRIRSFGVDSRVTRFIALFGAKTKKSIGSIRPHPVFERKGILWFNVFLRAKTVVMYFNRTGCFTERERKRERERLRSVTFSRRLFFCCYVFFYVADTINSSGETHAHTHGKEGTAA